MKKGVCDVCFYVDNDATIKDVEYCETCNAYICSKCKPNLFRRGMAMIKKQASILKLIFILLVVTSCKKEETKPQHKTYTIEIKGDSGYDVKLNGINLYNPSIVNAKSGDKIQITNEGFDSWNPNTGTKYDGYITQTIYINNTIDYQVNCNCDLNYIKILQ